MRESTENKLIELASWGGATVMAGMLVRSGTYVIDKLCPEPNMPNKYGYNISDFYNFSNLLMACGLVVASVAFVSLIISKEDNSRSVRNERFY